MKSKMLWIIAGALLLLPTGAAANEMYSVRDELDKMKMELDLTPKQTRKVEAILQDFKDQVDQAKDEKKDKLDDILSDEQKDKLEAMDQSWLDKMKARMKGDQATEAPSNRTEENMDRDTGSDRTY